MYKFIGVFVIVSLLLTRAEYEKSIYLDHLALNAYKLSQRAR